MLPTAISGKRFQPVGRRRAQVAQVHGMMQHIEFAQSLFLESTKAFHGLAQPKPLSFAISKRSDHLMPNL
jgi:hypothetical protein